MKDMNAFEKWQFVIFCMNTAILLIGTLSAVYIGFKQNEISSKQTKINEQLLDLEYEISVEVNYRLPDKKILLFNRGRHNIYFGGGKFGDDPPDLRTPPAQIAVGGTHFISTEDPAKFVPAAGNARKQIPCDIYLLDERGTKYVLHSVLTVHQEDDKVDISFRTSAPEKKKW
jgi:hypothetical protein